jgi:hypothetical protein
MSFASPFKLGPFIVDEEGRLYPRVPDKVPSFSVCWRDRLLHLRLSRAAAAGATQLSLGVQAVLGRIPSTAEAIGPGRRDEAFALLRNLAPVLPAGWEISLFADHRVRLDLQSGLELPTSATALVTAVTVLLLELAPYLDVLDAEGIVAVPRSAEGMANAWPG